VKSEDAETFTESLSLLKEGWWRQMQLAEKWGVPKDLGMSLDEWAAKVLGGYSLQRVEERRAAVKELVADHVSNRKIATYLGVSPMTITNDRRAIEAEESQEESEGDVNNFTPNGEEIAPDQEESEEDVNNFTPNGEADDGPQEESGPVEVELKPVEPGWYELGPHLLYCGDSTDQEFIDACSGAALAFADPPYNAGKAQWDNEFKWNHDYLSDAAAIVAVTPGVASLAGFLGATAMPYRWCMSAEITNGMTRGALGFGNWIAVTLFSNGSIYRKSKDVLRVPAATGDDAGGKHPSRKPLRLLTNLIALFTSKDDLVVDPFLGSGTTLIAADREGRRCVGAEIDPLYCAEIIARYETT
jgi:hypothetical protein